MLEPGWPRVVEVGERPLAELGGIEAGRIEPAVAEADELPRGPGDDLALLVGPEAPWQSTQEFLASIDDNLTQEMNQ